MDQPAPKRRRLMTSWELMEDEAQKAAKRAQSNANRNLRAQRRAMGGHAPRSRAERAKAFGNRVSRNAAEAKRTKKQEPDTAQIERERRAQSISVSVQTLRYADGANGERTTGKVEIVH